MNWDAIGAIGQVLGSVAVFVTLGYLAVQVKHARSEARRALSQGRAEGLRDLYAQACDERIGRIMAKGSAAFGAPEDFTFASVLMGQAGLTREEVGALIWFQSSWWNHRVQIITHVDELPAEERVVFDNGIRGQYGRPGVWRLYYEEIAKPLAHPKTVAYIENLLAQPG